VRLRLEALSAELVGFLNTFDNQIVSSTIDGEPVLVNGGATRSYGLEASAGIELGGFIHPDVLCDLSGSYTLMKATFVGGEHDGHELPYAPNHRASAVLALGHAIGLGGQLAYHFVGEQFSDDANTPDETAIGDAGRLDAYHLLDANV